MRTLESKQIEGTISENIRYFQVDGNTVKAVFLNVQQAREYANKFFDFNNGVGCKHTQKGFAYFTWDYKSDYIEGHSTYHSISTIIDIFENGKF